MPGCGQMEPLPYLQGEREEGRAAARRVNIAYTGHDARGAYLNRSLPYLPLEIRDLITGYAGPPVAPGQRVGGVSQQELWHFDRRHGRTAFLAPVHAMLREIRRLRNILMQPYTRRYLNIWREQFRALHERLHLLEDRLRNLIRAATTGFHPPMAWAHYRNTLQRQRDVGHEVELHSLYNHVERLGSQRAADEPGVVYHPARETYMPRRRRPGL